MSQPVRLAISPPANRPTFNKWAWLIVSLLLISLPACTPVGTFVSPTQSGPARSTSLPFVTSSASSEVIPSQTATLAPSPTDTTLPTTPAPTDTYTPEPSATRAAPVIFAAIGDYGSGDQAEADVANVMLSRQPDFIITTGDNNYPDGSADFIDQAIGQFYHSYIYPYIGSYGAGAEVNKFFPSLGNHDLLTDNGQPYYDYFTLPGNERYYDFTWGPVHLFALDNLGSEPDGVTADSIQGAWLQQGLAASSSPWNIVYMHYPPYSSGLHGSTDWARWPYKDWGAQAVLAGHDHTYERLEEDGLTYFVNGLGGGGIYYFPNILEGSQVRYNEDYGAMRVEATENYMLFEFINRSGEIVDSYELRK